LVPKPSSLAPPSFPRFTPPLPLCPPSELDVALASEGSVPAVFPDTELASEIRAERLDRVECPCEKDVRTDVEDPLVLVMKEAVADDDFALAVAAAALLATVAFLDFPLVPA
jgi:hypothetical protein